MFARALVDLAVSSSFFLCYFCASFPIIFLRNAGSINRFCCNGVLVHLPEPPEVAYSSVWRPIPCKYSSSILLTTYPPGQLNSALSLDRLLKGLC